MSTNLNYQQVANVSRRKWDTETYEKRAQARQEQLRDNSDGGTKQRSATATATASATATEDGDDTKEEFTRADATAAKPEGSDRAFLKARRGKVEIDDKVGTTELVSADQAATTSTADTATANEGGISAGVTKSGIGWHCKVCDCFLKDSLTYLDHINGRKHQRALGYSMRVERSTKDGLLAKLSQLTKAKEEQEKRLQDPTAHEPTNYADIVKAKDDEALRRKEERARKRKERKQRLVQKEPADEEQEEDVEEEAETGGMDPAMAAMMGFSGFGGGNKN
jgi:U4/U6.U5 tri-snRNP component SNU23